jgi:predicted alpha/beta hydrolase family esterase
MSATVLIVPGLRDAQAGHWQTLLATRLPAVRSVPPLGREDLSLERRIASIEHEAGAIDGPIVLVAHSGGVIATVHWAARTRRAVAGALLAVPPDFDTPMPDGYPRREALRAAGWLPVPRARLAFPSVVAASRNDPLASYDCVRALAHDWGSRLVDLGEVGHLNPASGYGEWPGALPLIAQLAGAPADAS